MEEDEESMKVLLEEDENLLQIKKQEEPRLSAVPNLSEFQRQKLDKDAKKNWDLFYKRNGDRFFKNRYWTKREFKELFDCSTVRGSKVSLLETGCGCGDFVLPLLGNDRRKDKGGDDTKLPNNMFIYCCDISSQAIEILSHKQTYIDNNPHKIKAFVADITQDLSTLQGALDGDLMDFVSLIFVLSALDPKKMNLAVANISELMKPGGLVLFRDYAIYDEAMLRFKDNSKICDQFYVRQDGTRAYFFSKEQLRDLFVRNNFHCQSVDYVHRETINSAKQSKFSRIFLQAKFRRKGTEEEASLS